MKTTNQLLFIIFVLFLFACKKDDQHLPLQPQLVSLNFLILDPASDSNLDLEYVVDSLTSIIDPNTGNYYPAAGHTNIKYKGKTVKKLKWVSYNAIVVAPGPIFWAKVEVDYKIIYVLLGSEHPFGISKEIYVIDNDIFKVEPMLANDSITAIVPTQIKYTLLKPGKRLIYIRCNPNAGLITYFIDEATGIFKY